MDLLRIAIVEPLEGLKVRMTLTDGFTITRDLSALLQGPAFEAIRSAEDLFRQVMVKDGSLAWPNGADLCPDVLIWGGMPPAQPAHPAQWLAPIEAK